MGILRGKLNVHSNTTGDSMKYLRDYVMICLLMLVGLLTGGCAVNSQDIRGFNVITIEEEKGLGVKFAAEIEKQHKLLNDPEVDAYLDRMGKRLLTGVREVDFAYRFKAVQDNTVNAFAIPGGSVYIHTGLIKSAKNEHELAGVVAHEVNHVVARHGTRQMTQQYGYALVLQLVLGDNPGLIAQMATSLFGQAGSMAYSRGMESQADVLAVETMAKSGYDPNGMATFLGTLKGLQQESPGKIAKFFSSHPDTGDRVQQVRAEIAKLPTERIVRTNDAEFKRIQGRVH